MADVSLIAYADDGAGTLLSPLPMLDHNPRATNDQIKSNDLADAEWTATNMTVGDQDEVGIDGAPATACTLTAAAANATLIANAITASSGNHATKWYLQRGVGTGVVELAVDGGSTWQAITASLDADFAPGIVVDQAAVTNPQIGIRIVTSGDAVIVGNAECHLDSSIAILRNAAPIITTTDAVIQAADAYSLDVLNHDNAEVCYYMEWSPGYSSGVPAQGIVSLMNASLGNVAYLVGSSGVIRTYDGTNVVSTANTAFSVGDEIKIGIVASISSNSMRVCRDGVWSSSGAYNGYVVQSLFNIMLSASYPARMRGLQRWAITGATAQRAKIDELMV